jgi:GT2 family glycosyltransferase/glycosyltransferase involved in cell wall biosynthesis
MSALQVFFFPDYRRTNPYQTLLYSGFPQEWEAVPGTVFDVLDYMEGPGTADKVAFHLHWTSPILASAANKKQAERVKESFIKNLLKLREKGCRIVWTIHNVLPHDDRFLEIEIDLREQIGRVADRIHIHSTKSIEQIRAVYDLPQEKLSVLPHGNYVNVYPNYVTRDQARKRFGFMEDDIVFLFLGQLRPYKGIDELFTAFSRLHNRHSRAKLLIAGEPVHPYRPGMVAAKSNILQGVTVVEGHIPDDQLQWFFNAVDMVVLPYRKILTSGSVLNAMSFSRPVIAPDVGMLNEFVKEGVTGYRFEAGNADDLFRKMESFTGVSRDQRLAMCERAFGAIEPFTWDAIGSELISAVMRAPPPVDSLAVKRQTKEIHIESGSYHCEVLDRLTEFSTPGRVAVIILNYEHLEDTVRAVASVEASSYRAFDVIVVDNHSSDTSIQSMDAHLGSCTLIRSPTNLGYAGGNNLAIEYIKEKPFEFVWVLNPDAVVEVDSLAGYVDAASGNSGVNIFGAVITNYFDPATVWFGGGVVDLSHGLRTFHMFAGTDVASMPDEPYEVDYITGASLFVRKDAFSRLGTFPERYFLYFEETDWCLRAREKGERLLLIPSVRLRHAKRSEERNIPTKTYFYYYIRNFLLFASEFNSERVVMARRSLEQEFVDPWLAQISERCPQEKDYYELLATRAMRDGNAGVSGRIDLLKLFCRSDASRSAPSVKGHLDEVDVKTISGWAMNQIAPSERLEVSIMIDDELYRHVPTGHYRGDLKRKGIGDGFYGFSISTPHLLFDSQPHRIKATVRGTDIELSESPKVVTLTAPPRNYVGRLDGISHQYVHGWAYDEADPEERLWVEVLCDGRVITSAHADRHRSDLERSNLGSNQCGFKAPFPVALSRERGEHELQLRIKHSKQIIRSATIKVQPPKGVSDAQHSPVELLRSLYHYRELLMVLPGNAEHPALGYFESLYEMLQEQYSDSRQDHLISIVMPAYNRADTIAASIESVLEQSYRNWELLVVDDGSSDSTSEVVHEFVESIADGRIQLIRLEENGGVSRARNVGIEHAKGEVFAYLDSDNLWEADYLLIMLNSLLDSEWAQSVYCGQKIWRIISGEEVETELYSLRIGGFNRALLENRNYLDLNVFVHKRALYERFGGFREDMARLVDWELILRYTAAEPPKFVPLFLNHYFIGKTDNQITAVADFSKNCRIVRDSIESADSFLYSDVAFTEQRSQVEASRSSHRTVIVVLPANDAHSLGLALNALIANTCLKDASVVVHIDRKKHEMIDLFKQNYSQVSEFELNLIESGTSSLDVLGQAMQRDNGHFVLLDSEAVVGHGWLRALQQAAEVDDGIAAVVSREIRPGAEAARMEIPYVSSALKADVTVKPGQVVNEHFCERKSLVEIAEFSMFCTYFPYDMRLKLKNFAHHERRKGEWKSRVSIVIRELMGRHIVYTPEAKVFHASCFQ